MKKENLRVIPTVMLAASAIFSGCTDSGSSPTGPRTSSSAPTIVLIEPLEASVGDTLTITGSNFGASRGPSSVVVGGVAITAFVMWSDTVIRAAVPAGPQTGDIVVVVGGVSSNQISITLKGAPPPQLSFKNDVLPIFAAHGCIGCHGGTNSLFVGSVAQLLQGGIHGPAIVPGNSQASILIQKVSSSPPFGARMPQGGPYLDSTTINVIAKWIEEGANNN